jgi:preprotein translocase subunit SecD
MARSGRNTAAKRTLIWLGVLIAVLTAALSGGVLSNQASWAPKLALDLEGGTQMILAPQVQGGGNQITSEQLDQAVEIIRQRVDGSGVAEAEISTQSGRNVIVSLPGVPDEKTRDLIQASAAMEFRPVLAATSGAAVPKESRTPEAELPKPKGKPANASDLNWITPKLYQELEARDCTDPATVAAASEEPSDPKKPMIACEPETGQKYILGPVEVPGTDIQDASFGQVRGNQGQSLNKWAVNIEFNGEGTQTFKSVTERLFGLTGAQNQFAIVLDGNVISAPTTNAVIPDGRPQITGNFTEESARALSEQLKYGALPISFDIQSETQISATLGDEQLRMGVIAGLIGLLLVAIYSFFQYRVLGFVTIASLVVAGILTYLAIALLGWTENYRLSLAGVAGLIVAIGQTADSFIVYFERIRDELRDGRGLVSAVDNGWKRAKRTVLASKAVNLLAAVVLYFVAVGNVRGFAFTLGLTAIADLAVVFLFTHPMMMLLARTKFFGEGHRFSGLDPKLLGAVPLYRGAGRIRQPGEAAPKPRGRTAGAAAEAQRRQTIAERRAAAEKERAAAVSGRSTDKESN